MSDTNGIVVASSAPVTLAGGSKSAVLAGGKAATEKVLDAAVAEVKRLKVQSSESIWSLGQKIKEIHTEKLWALRTEDGGKGGKKAKWKSFEAFCLHELGFTPQTAHALSDVSSSYGPDDIKKFGTAKLTLVLQAPPADRPRIQERVEKGATKKEIEKEVRQAKKDTKYVREARETSKGNKTGKAGASKGKALTKAREAKAAKPKKELATQITIAKIIGSETVKLYKRPTTRDFELEKLPRATRLADSPYGVLDLANGVEMHFNVTEAANGSLVLKVHTKRSE